ncbi:hypothetical protein ZWY2020_034519 [Hordeum vulgare]|nr:hypothetical protein ZWY2020_034519 [Hordeum vulgare]
MRPCSSCRQELKRDYAPCRPATGPPQQPAATIGATLQDRPLTFAPPMRPLLPCPIFSNIPMLCLDKNQRPEPDDIAAAHGACLSAPPQGPSSPEMGYPCPDLPSPPIPRWQTSVVQPPRHSSSCTCTSIGLY